MTPQGQQAKGSAVDSNFVWENWEKTCGHEFVEQVVQGASLYISIKLEFSTKASKTSFDAQFSLSGPMFEVGGKLNIASQQFGKTASLSIQAYQLGGDVAKLSQALNASLGDKPEIKAIAVCSMDNPDACLKLLNGAIKYATDEFPNQINPALGTDNPAGPADLIYITKPWSDLALYPPPAIIADGVRVAREDLSFQFERNLKYRNRVKALLNGPMRLSPAQQTKIEHIDVTVSDNLSLINDAANICYSQMDRCVAKVDEVKRLLKSVNEEDFDVYPETIAQWYEIKDLPSTLQEVRKIMDRLERFVKDRVNNWDEIKPEDKGDLIGKLLKDDKEISLENTEISNLAHLSWLSSLPNLKILNLAGCKIITDISPLSSLINLTTINLALNQITDISPLSSLTNLTDIFLDYNPIADISTLALLKNLKTISFGDTQVKDISALSVLPNIIGLSIGNNLENAKIENSEIKFFNNLFFIADKISLIRVSDDATATTIYWTRRSKSNIFDVHYLNSDGNNIDKVITLGGIHLRELILELRFSDNYLGELYYAKLSDDGREVISGNFSYYSADPKAGKGTWTAKIVP